MKKAVKYGGFTPLRQAGKNFLFVVASSQETKDSNAATQAEPAARDCLGTKEGFTFPLRPKGTSHRHEVFHQNRLARRKPEGGTDSRLLKLFSVVAVCDQPAPR